MLVYCNALRVDDPNEREKVLSIIARWLGKTTGTYVTEKVFSNNSKQKTYRGNYQIIVAVQSFPKMYSVQLSHADEQISGRQWITEIGIRQYIECSDPEKLDS